MQTNIYVNTYQATLHILYTEFVFVFSLISSKEELFAAILHHYLNIYSIYALINHPILAYMLYLGETTKARHWTNGPMKRQMPCDSGAINPFWVHQQLKPHKAWHAITQKNNAMEYIKTFQTKSQYFPYAMNQLNVLLWEII